MYHLHTFNSCYFRLLSSTLKMKTSKHLRQRWRNMTKFHDWINGTPPFSSGLRNRCRMTMSSVRSLLLQKKPYLFFPVISFFNLMKSAAAKLLLVVTHCNVTTVVLFRPRATQCVWSDARNTNTNPWKLLPFQTYLPSLNSQRSCFHVPMYLISL